MWWFEGFPIKHKNKYYILNFYGIPYYIIIKTKLLAIFICYPSFVYSCLYLNLDALVIYILIFDINKSSNVHIQFISSWFNGPRRQEKWLSWCSTKGHPKLVLTGNYKMHIIRIVIKSTFLGELWSSKHSLLHVFIFREKSISSNWRQVYFRSCSIYSELFRISCWK